MRNGVAILSKNIKLDKNYKSVLGYTEDEMISLLTNQNNLVYYANNLSFTRENNEIILDVPYSEAIKSNYLAFKNPRYSDKWFFAFIDEVVFTGTAQSKIRYTVDIFSTWWSYWSPKACFVIREHVVDDTIGLHTVPENVETGEYLPKDHVIMNYGTPLANPYYVCVAVTENLMDNQSGIFQYNDNYCGFQYLAIRDENSLRNLLTKYNNASKIDAIVALFIIPGMFAVVNNNPVSWDVVDGIYYTRIDKKEDYFDIKNITVSRPSQIGVGNDLYTPKNNKLLTGQFIYILCDNQAGATAKYNYEYFTNPATCTFTSIGAICPGCSIKAFPLNYNGGDYNIGVMASKLPIGGWYNDIYTNWLTQNGVNIGLSIGSSALQIAGGLALALGTGGAGALTGASSITSGALGIANTVGQVYSHSLEPNQARGNLNAGDINLAYNNIYPIYYRMSIKAEYGRIIDDYFTRQGYLVNRIKVPNMTHRENYNFVQIASEDNLCYPNNYNNLMIPAKALDTINTLFRNGITIWNNHENFGNYSVSNNITQ